MPHFSGCGLGFRLDSLYEGTGELPAEKSVVHKYPDADDDDDDDDYPFDKEFD
jgi:hypothetical protein